MMATHKQAEPADEPEPLPMALLLATTGGLLDAVTYMNHGHVFANAMTGNVVLLGIAVLSRSWAEAMHHVAPLVAFLAGVMAAQWTRLRLGRMAHPATLLLEMAVLLGVGWLPGRFPEIAFISLVAFVASLQVTSFRHVGPLPYNSTFLTGNLRDTAQGFYDAVIAGGLDRASRREGLRKARALGSICVCFLAGAVAGALAAPRLGNRSFWLAEPLLGTVLAMVWRARRR